MNQITVSTTPLDNILETKGVVSEVFQVNGRGDGPSETFSDAVDRTIEDLSRQAVEIGANAISGLVIAPAPTNHGTVYIAYGTAVLY